ncbi:MAG: YajQ family cyclic di-GMP-binding protein [Gammaproteobacteria bacterium]|jgi:hypothetical protein|nr:YajQ family cyclic di-GMP-binding protein [Gammaproteobacteria bacterium]
MPSFDVVSQVDLQEVRNAVDQANREITNRFDFKGSDARVEQAEAVLTLFAEDEFRIGQVRDLLEGRLAKRGVDIACLALGSVESAGGDTARQVVTVRQGVDKDLARDIVKRVKNAKLKVQAAIQGEQVRITGKKRDDLQQVIAMLKEAKIDLPLQYINFRD